MADLPQSFLDSMKEILGEDYEAFLTGFDGQRQYGLRVNTLKMNLEEFERIAPFHLKKFRGFQMDIFTKQKMFQQSILLQCRALLFTGAKCYDSGIQTESAAGRESS